MAKKSLPPGFRFHPTDVELVLYHLKWKIKGKSFPFEAIAEVQLYKFDPWELPDKSCLQSKDLEWYFFCLEDRKYSTGFRKNRKTKNGYWKTTGKDRAISYKSRTVAMRKTLVFHSGKVAERVRTDWVMYEYKLVDKELGGIGSLQNSYVLCKIFEKSGPGPKNGEQYGAPFNEEDWEDDEANDTAVLLPPTCDGPISTQLQSADQVLQTDSYAADILPPCTPEYINVDRLLQDLLENSDGISVAQDVEVPYLLTLHRNFAEKATFSDGNAIYNGSLEDLSSIEPKSAAGIYFRDDMGERALEHDLLNLSSQAEARSIVDICPPYGEDNIRHQTLLGIDDGSYLEMNDLHFPMEGHHY